MNTLPPRCRPPMLALLAAACAVACSSLETPPEAPAGAAEGIGVSAAPKSAEEDCEACQLECRACAPYAVNLYFCDICGQLWQCLEDDSGCSGSTPELNHWQAPPPEITCDCVDRTTGTILDTPECAAAAAAAAGRPAPHPLAAPPGGELVSEQAPP